MEVIIPQVNAAEQVTHNGLFARLGHSMLEKLCSIMPPVPETREDALAIGASNSENPAGPLSETGANALRTAARLQGEHGFIRLF